MLPADENNTIDVDRVRRETFVRGIECYPELPSTNTHALHTAGLMCDLPHVVIALRQTTGRGRGRNQWWSEGGSLTFSVVVGPTPSAGISSGRSLVPFSAGLAVADAVDAVLADLSTRSGVAPNLQARLKWPNDIYLNDRKLAGILVESVSNSPGRVVIGVGINVNNSFTTAAADIQLRATSLLLQTQSSFALTDLLVEFLRRLEHWEAERDGRPWRLIESFQDRCWLTGKSVRITTPQEELSGHCEGIDDDGSLLLLTQRGRRKIVAGTVEHVG